MKRFLSLLMVLVLMSSILVVPTYAAEAEGSTITVSGNNYRNKYVVISDGTASGLYYITNTGLV